MKTCQNIHELARELKIERKLLYTWKVDSYRGSCRTLDELVNGLITAMH